MGVSEICLNGEVAFFAQHLGLSMSVTPGYVAAGVALEFPWRNEDNIVFSDPDSAFHFAADSAQPLFAVLAFDHDAVEAQ